MDDDRLQRECYEIVSKLLKRYSWNLLTIEELVTEVLAQVRSENPVEPRSLQTVALTLYSIRLFQACSSSGVEREQGFQEVGTYLFQAINQRPYAPAIGHELVSDALKRSWQGLSQCQAPATFLRFCLYRLRHAETAFWRAQQQLDEHEPWPEELPDEGQWGRKASTAAFIYEETFPTVDDDQCTQLHEKVLQQFAGLYQRFPRAKDQLTAVFWYYFVGLSTEEIAKRVDKGVEQVHVLLSRGRDKLRTDEEFVTLLFDFRENCKD